MSLKNFLQHNPYYTVTAYAILYCITLALVFGFNSNPWTDEEHFYFTILEFIQHPDVATLKHYEEMSTPLPFIIYGVWGWLFGADLATLRVLSLLVAFTTIVSAFHLFAKAGLSTTVSFICIFILTLNPYFAGVSFLVYTDMLCELFMIGAFISLIQRNILLSCICLLLATLCRQYMVFFIPAMAVYLFMEEKATVTVSLIRKELLLLIPVVGLGALFVFWGGATPDNTLKTLYIYNAFAFHGDALTAYMAASVLYTFPVLLVGLKALKKMHVLIVLPVAVLWYVLFPVQGSQVAMASILHIDTIGMVHKATHHLPGIAEQLVWCLLFVVSCLIWVCAFDAVYKKYHPQLFLICSSWLFFLLTMSFSYLTWEKYLLPVLPLLLVYGGMLLDTYRLKQFNRIAE